VSGDTSMAAARAHAVDFILRQVIGRDPEPTDGGVVLIDRPSRECVEIRYFVKPQTYVLSTNRLCFERAPDGSLRLSPCPPRRRARPDAVRIAGFGPVSTQPLGPVQTASWFFDRPVRLVDTDTIHGRA
jgi:hypothetical protein